MSNVEQAPHNPVNRQPEIDYVNTAWIATGSLAVNTVIDALMPASSNSHYTATTGAALVAVNTANWFTARYNVSREKAFAAIATIGGAIGALAAGYNAAKYGGDIPASMVAGNVGIGTIVGSTIGVVVAAHGTKRTLPEADPAKVSARAAVVAPAENDGQTVSQSASVAEVMAEESEPSAQPAYDPDAPHSVKLFYQPGEDPSDMPVQKFSNNIGPYEWPVMTPEVTTSPVQYAQPQDKASPIPAELAQSLTFDLYTHSTGRHQAQ